MTSFRSFERPGEKKKSLKGEGMVGPYSITSTAQGMTDTKKAVIAEYLTKLDAVGARVPLVKRWRKAARGRNPSSTLSSRR